MKIKRFTGGTLESNGYVLYVREGGSCFIIDPGYDPKVFLVYIRDMKLDLKGIILTHHHYDHTGAVDRIKNETGCPVYLHREDCDMYGNKVDVYMEDSDIIDLDGVQLEVIHTPGHTRGSVCIFDGKDRVCFTGDTIFNVDLGRTDLEDGSEEQMIRSITEIIDRWPNDIMIYPGHGDGCTMKKVRKINREFTDIIERYA
ncbi:MAG: MBL fold metallo-hydrolase [Clostridiales bacterium]|nr:MBL fold metallo-hydrolase [Clostridiales bacterium]